MDGADISGYQGNLNWDTLGALGFIISKATEGVTFVDPSFAHNLSEGRRTGKLRGYYHYARPDKNDPVSEADHFVNTVGSLQAGEIMALDWEQAYGGGRVAWCLPFLNRVEQRSGVKAYIYMNRSEMKSTDWSPIIGQGYPLWIAAPGAAKPATPGWNCPLWQYSFSGVSGGDADRFDGNANAFMAYGFGGGTPVQLKEDDMSMFVAPQVLPKQGDWFVWHLPEGVVALDWLEWAKTWLYVNNEGKDAVELQVFTTPGGEATNNGKHFVVGGWSRLDIPVGDIAASHGVKNGFATIVKAKSDNLSLGVTVWDKLK